MPGKFILSRFAPFGGWKRPTKQADLHALWIHPELRPWFAQGPTEKRLIELLGPLNWAAFPERNLHRNWGHTTVSYAAFAATYLLKLNEGLDSMGDVRRYLVEHPSFIRLFGFPLVRCARSNLGFDLEASLPTQRHLTQMLCTIPNSTLQFLLADSVRLILNELHILGVAVNDCISLDTKHILAWVIENNPKAYIEGRRYDKTQQPKGDPDCKLGCKRKHNRRKKGVEQPASTPASKPVPAEKFDFGEFYWGYGSGVVAIKIPGLGEFVLAELTQTFDKPDVSYFFPLMDTVERRLGYKPRCGTFDAVCCQ